VAGEVFAMAGASKVHGTLALNLESSVDRSLALVRPHGCWRLRLRGRSPIGWRRYAPDLGPNAPKDYVGAPKLVLEVLSDSTEPVDRREKLLSYRRLASLEEYVLVDQNKAWMEAYRRTPAGWVQEVYGSGESVRFTSIDLAVPLAGC